MTEPRPLSGRESSTVTHRAKQRFMFSFMWSRTSTFCAAVLLQAERFTTMWQSVRRNSSYCSTYVIWGVHAAQSHSWGQSTSDTVITLIHFFHFYQFRFKNPKTQTANTKYCPEMQKCKILNHIIITKGLKCQVMQYKYIHRIATDTEIQQCNMFPSSADVCRRPAFTACKITWTVTTSIPDPRGETFLCRVDVRRWKNSEKVN